MLIKPLSEDYVLRLRPHQVDGPATPREFAHWNIAMKKWRREKLEKTPKDSITVGYDVPNLIWMQSNYAQLHVMAHDIFLFDYKTNTYTVDRFLKDTEERYGLIDSVVIWPVFPNLGCDSRNTEDFFRSLPGGTYGTRGLVEQFHQRNVRVIFSVLPWDNGTRDPQADWSYVLPRLMKEYHVDGMLSEVAYFTQEYWLTSLAIGYPLVLQSAADVPETMNRSSNEDDTSFLRFNTTDTAKYDTRLRIPTVASRKYTESRHMTHSTDRWSRNKTDLIQHAFFNGIGVDTWENIFGTWNQMTPRDGEALRRTSSILRAFGPTFLSSPEWEPHSPCINYKNVFSSKWKSTACPEQSLWTFVNRGPFQVNGHQIVVGYRIGLQFYDVWHGRELYPSNIVDGLATLTFDIEPKGYGCIFASPDMTELPFHFNECLAFMAERSKIPLQNYPISNSILWQELDEIKVSPIVKQTPPSMVRIDGDQYQFRINGRENHPPGIEYPGVDIQYPWEFEPTRIHSSHQIKMRPFYIDVFPVTEKQFKEFLDVSHYQPSDPTNFLKHWSDGTYPCDTGNKPVTHVSIEDARAYAQWAGKRLPHEWEWQYVAQGGVEYRTYPWGDIWDDERVPESYTGRDRLYPNHPPADVDAHVQGRSVFGVYDLVGNVWEWTDVYVDEHTRAAVIRGGSYYTPQHSDRYFPQAYRNDEHGKYLLMSPSMDRSGTIGFRCVKDTEESAAAYGNCPWYGQED
ncbi:C-type lectin protein [Spinellus fusiger]|nr:C-type lectin protein [Spinellus fusiger]